MNVTTAKLAMVDDADRHRHAPRTDVVRGRYRVNEPGPSEHDATADPRPAAARILLVEDEMLSAIQLEATVIDAGYRARKVARLSSALTLARTETFEAAVLDVNLDGELVYPLAALLRERGVPFLFATGYGDAGVPAEYRDCMVLDKPCLPEEVIDALRVLLAGRTER